MQEFLRCLTVLSVCSPVCSIVCRLWNVLTHLLGGSIWQRVGALRIVFNTLVLSITWYNTLCLQVDPASSMAIIIAAQNGDINVHANKAQYGSGAAYLALALQKRPTPLYNHYVPGCNITGLFFSSDWIFHSFVSVVSVYESTDVEVIKYSDVIGGPSQRLHFRTMQVQSNVTRTEY